MVHFIPNSIKQKAISFLLYNFWAWILPSEHIQQKSMISLSTISILWVEDPGILLTF